MQAIKCPQCGAPADVEAGAPTHQCPFCKTSFQLAQAQAQAQAHDASRAPVHVHVIMPGHYPEAPAPQPSVAREIGRSAGRALSPLILLGGIVLLTSALGGGYAFSGLSFGGGWDGTKPFSCRGNDVVRVKNVTATFTTGAAISVDTNCHFECEDCTINAPVVARVSGNGEAVFVNGSIDGTEAIADVSVNGRFEARGNVQVKGAKPRKSGNGQIAGLPALAPSGAPNAASTAPAASPPTKAPLKPATGHR